MKLSIDRRDALYVAPPLLASAIASLASEVTPFSPRTTVVYGFEGNLVSLFQTVTHPILTTEFILTYVGLYPLLLGLTYVYLKREPGNRHVRYAATYTLVVLVSTPVFYFFPVSVTGHFLGGVEPILYENGGLVSWFVTSVDTLEKAMPSLHLALAATASLHAPRGHRLTSWLGTGLIALSTLYLGIHWMSDLVVGGVIAYSCYLATTVVGPHLQDHWSPTSVDPVRGD